MSMNKQTFLFDLDGTLTDPKKGITKSVQYSLRAFGIHVEEPDELVCFIGPPLKDSYRDFYQFSDQEAGLAVDKYREYFSQQGIFENTLYPGIKPMLERLMLSKAQLVVATSKPTVYANQILEHFGLDRYFDFVAGSELDGSRSKKSQVIQHAIDNAKITDIRQAIMIGDREHDIIGAKAHGMDAVGVLYGYGSRAELQGANADYIAETVEALSGLLQGLRGK